MSDDDAYATIQPRGVQKWKLNEKKYYNNWNEHKEEF